MSTASPATATSTEPAAMSRPAAVGSGLAPANEAIALDALVARLAVIVSQFDVALARLLPLLQVGAAHPAVTGVPDRDHGQDWLTAKEAAPYLGLPSVKALYAAVARRQVPAKRLGPRRLRFRSMDLDHVLSQRRTHRVQQLPRVPSPGKEPERW